MSVLTYLKFKHNLNCFYKTCFLFFLILIVSSLMFSHGVKAAETSKFVPQPEFYSFTEKEMPSGEIVFEGTGKSINFSQVKVYLDQEFLTFTQNEIGPLGWQEFEFNMPAGMSLDEHQIGLIAEYFNNTQSPTTTVSFLYQAKFPAPTLFNPVLNFETNYQQPWIVGLAFNDSFLEFYIDDQFAGQVLVENHPSGVTDFKYQPVEKLSPGFHLVKVRAISPDGRTSAWSNEIIFEVRKDKQILAAPGLFQEQGEFIAPVPAPTLIEPKHGLITKDSKLIVAGLMHNNHQIKIFADNELVAEFMPQPHASGVTDFVWQAEENLSAGLHTLWAQATNSSGQTSGQSNILKFIILPAEPVFVSQLPIGRINAAAHEEVTEITQEEIPEEKLAEQIVNKVAEKINGWADWWKYLIGLIVLIALILIIIWLSSAKQEKTPDEKIKIKTGDEKESPLDENQPATEQSDISTPPYSEPGIDIGFENEEEKNEDEYFPPPPPPPDAPSLGI